MRRKSRFLIATDDDGYQLPKRRTWSAALRDAVPSYALSFVAHALLFLIPIGWFLSKLPDLDDPSLLLTELDQKQVGLESILNAPEEMPVLESYAAPEIAPFELTRRDEPGLKDFTLPSLKSQATSAPSPAPPKTTPDVKNPPISDSVDQALEDEIQKRLNREGGKSGVVQISLMWNNGNDIDLYVQTPVGDLIAFNYKKSRCGGELDVDMNAKKVQSLKPVENVFWSANKAPYGVFIVGVHEYQNHGFREPTPFLVSVKVDGEVRQFRGNIRIAKDLKGVCKFRRTSQGVTFLETPDTFGNSSGKRVFK